MECYLDRGIGLYLPTIGITFDAPCVSQARGPAQG